MPLYRVSAPLVEVKGTRFFSISAKNAKEAMLAVSKGKGDWLYDSIEKLTTVKATSAVEIPEL